jgi:hypothetical protein
MRQREYTRLVRHLVSASAELFQDHDLGFPQTRDEYMRAMWQEDTEMKHWKATREDYTDALREAYDIVKVYSIIKENRR